jgi:glutamate dehydrogenase (NAD(P)+)
VELTDQDLDLRAFLVVDRLGSGLCAGGLRFAPSVSAAGLELLARLMTLKFGAMGVPLGGAKAGIVGTRGADRDEAVLRRTAELLEPFLRSWYLIGEDLGTRAADVLLVYEHIDLDPVRQVRDRMAARGVRLSVPAGLRAADLFNEEVAGGLAGAGVAEAAASAAEVAGLRLDRLRVAVQGFGSVGLSAARRLTELGATVVAVADRGATISAPRGLDLADLERARDRAGLIDRRRLRRPATLLAPEDWYRVPAELLVPAAVENAIGLADLPRINAAVRLVVEAANSPVTPEAEVALEQRGVAVVPDFIANAGSAAAFGILVTGGAGSLNEAVTEALRRIAAATREVLTGTGGTARQRAVALAERTFGRPEDQPSSTPVRNESTTRR